MMVLSDCSCKMCQRDGPVLLSFWSWRPGESADLDAAMKWRGVMSRWLRATWTRKLVIAAIGTLYKKNKQTLRDFDNIEGCIRTSSFVFTFALVSRTATQRLFTKAPTCYSLAEKWCQPAPYNVIMFGLLLVLYTVSVNSSSCLSKKTRWA